jgi:hypothetical protein
MLAGSRSRHCWAGQRGWRGKLMAASTFQPDSSSAGTPRMRASTITRSPGSSGGRRLTWFATSNAQAAPTTVGTAARDTRHHSMSGVTTTSHHTGGRGHSAGSQSAAKIPASSSRLRKILTLPSR